MNGNSSSPADANPPPGPAAPQCPRRAARLSRDPRPAAGWMTLDFWMREPFRFFFPAAALAGAVGVGLWLLLVAGWTQEYPGPAHARLMIQGFFGGFIFGFLGTSLPRLLEAPPLRASELLPLLALFLANTFALAGGWIIWGDALFLAELLWFAVSLLRRWPARKSLPPPGFLLVALAFVGAAAGTAIHAAQPVWNSEGPFESFLEPLARLLAWHGFPLLCILGAGGFLLPRFLNLGVRRRYPDDLVPSPVWKCSAGVAALSGLLILASFVAEAAGWTRSAGVARAFVVSAYLAWEMPVERLRLRWQGAHWPLALGVLCVPLGIFAAALWPSARTTLLHLELLGGFALVTLSVAARVVYGHSGERHRLEGRCLGFSIAAILIWIGLATRLAAGFFPGIQTSHYLYAALLWLAGLGLWAWWVLPRVFRPDPEE